MSSTEGPRKTYHGSCHCGKLRFNVTTTPLEDTEVVDCNCSICHRNGYLFIYCPDEALEFEKGGEDELTEYTFGKRHIAHYFCPTCGTSVIGKSRDPSSSYTGWRGINVRTLEDVSVDNLKRRHVNGKSL